MMRTWVLYNMAWWLPHDCAGFFAPLPAQSKKIGETVMEFREAVARNLEAGMNPEDAVLKARAAHPDLFSDWSALVFRKVCKWNLIRNLD